MKKALFLLTEPLVHPLNGVTIPVYYTIISLLNSCEVRVAYLSESADKVSCIIPGVSQHVPLVAKRSKLRYLLRYGLGLRPHYVRSVADLRKCGVADLIREYEPDIIHADLLDFAEAVYLAPPGCRTIMSPDDSSTLYLASYVKSPMTAWHMRLAYLHVLAKTWIYERAIFRKYDVVRMVSEYDIKYMKNVCFSGVDYTFIPNCVDTDALSPVEQINPKRMVYVGFASQMIEERLRACIDALEYVSKTQELVLEIVGKRYSADFISYCASRPWVRYRGFVKELRDAYSGCSIFVNPNDKANGIFNKYLEAMSMGLVCVGFKATFNGISGFVQDGNAVGIASFVEMTAALTRLAQDDLYRAEVGRRARALMVREYSTGSYAAKIRQTYLQSVEG
jgi:glycosyltransferase involved in cell wall biosynthesis